jgi:hypothetical protein
MGLFGGGITTTQQHLDIEDIREDLMILKNGIVSLVMETTALNFDLLAEEEQDAKIVAFAGVLNSLTFPLQVLISTTKKDVTSYIEKLEDHQKKQISPALQRQIEIYIRFIRNLTYRNEILDKRFFIAIPTIVGSEVIKTSPLKQMFGKPVKISNSGSLVERAKVELYPKRDFVYKQLKRMQIQARQLETDELIRLFYSLYDPDRVGLERLNIRYSDYTAGLVSSLDEDAEKTLAAEQKALDHDRNIN